MAAHRRRWFIRDQSKNIVPETEKRVLTVDFVSEFTYKMTYCPRGQIVLSENEHGQESKSKEKDSETDGEVSASAGALRERAPEGEALRRGCGRELQPLFCFTERACGKAAFGYLSVRRLSQSRRSRTSAAEAAWTFCELGLQGSFDQTSGRDRRRSPAKIIGGHPRCGTN